MMPGFQDAFSGGPCILFLFAGWNLDTPLKYSAAVLGTFAMGFSNELLLFIRRQLTRRLAHKPLVIRSTLALLYGLHMVLAYWMMLLVMTYEYVIFTALILGLVAGHGVFSIWLSAKDSIFGYELAPAGTEPTHPLDSVKIQAGGTPCCGGASSDPM